MNRRSVIFGLIAATIIATSPVAADEAQEVPPRLPQCEYEDSDNCYWDAKSRGNGKGRSFYVVNGEVTYVN